MCPREIGAADRKETHGQQARYFQPRPVSVAITYRGIYSLSDEIHEPVLKPQIQIQLADFSAQMCEAR
jgi:hypothetical protein